MSEMPRPILPNPFSAVLMAGGASRRMGMDKATLMVEGQPLWQKQLAVLRSIGPNEFFISGRVDGPWEDCGIPILPDTRADSGPLVGLLAALERMTCAWLIVLAVDLPHMTSGYLEAFIHLAQSRGVGQVPYGFGGFEPLAAVYPRRVLPLVRTALDQGRLALREFVADAEAAGLIERRPISAEQEPLFANVNTPEEAGRAGLLKPGSS